MYVYYNPNPYGRSVDDCTIRAISKLLDQSWMTTYWHLAREGARLGNLPNGNDVWGSYLKNRGFRRYILPNSCPDCYSVVDFCSDRPIGEFLLSTGMHVVAVIDGDYYDAWDSGNESPVYYWTKK